MDSNFVNNIIPRLRRFAQTIEVKEALVDKVWVIYGDTDLIEYEFERTGEIAVTKNGTTHDGSWRIMGSGRLRIKTDFANNTLEYNFSVPGILVMKIAGMQNSPFLLFNSKVVKNGDIGKYLETLELKFIQKQSVPLPHSFGGPSRIPHNVLMKRRLFWGGIIILYFILMILLITFHII
jgi:hypothetical protein